MSVPRVCTDHVWGRYHCGVAESYSCHQQFVHVTPPAHSHTRKSWTLAGGSVLADLVFVSDNVVASDYNRHFTSDELCFTLACTNALCLYIG